MNPFQIVFNALWSLAEGSIPLTSMVKEANRIKFNKTLVRDPIKQEIQDADLPELVLASNGITSINLHSTSCGSMITRRYTWMISTGDHRINLRLQPVEWALYCAMANWKEVLALLEWNGAKFVKRSNILDASEGLSDPERNRGIRGWSALWNCDVEMHFKTADLLVFNTSGG